MRIRLVLLLSLGWAFSCSAEPRDLILAVHHGVKETSYKPTDVESSKAGEQAMRTMLASFSPSLSFAFVSLRSLTQLSDLLRKVRPEYRIRGIAFFGHGSWRSFRHSHAEGFLAPSLAPLVRSGLAHTRVASDLFVYFHACFCGGRGQRVPFTTEFVDSFETAPGPPLALERLEVIGHRDPSSSDSCRPTGGFSRWAAVTRIPSLLGRLNIPLYKVPAKRHMPIIAMMGLLYAVPHISSWLHLSPVEGVLALFGGFALTGLGAGAMEWGPFIAANDMAITTLDWKSRQRTVRKGLASDVLPASFSCSTALAVEPPELLAFDDVFWDDWGI